MASVRLLNGLNNLMDKSNRLYRIMRIDFFLNLQDDLQANVYPPQTIDPNDEWIEKFKLRYRSEVQKLVDKANAI